MNCRYCKKRMSKKLHGNARHCSAKCAYKAKKRRSRKLKAAMKRKSKLKVMEPKTLVKTKTLHVKETSLKELAKHGFPIGMYYDYIPAYIQCNRKGEVNWNKASVYKAKELIERNNVKIIK